MKKYVCLLLLSILCACQQSEIKPKLALSPNTMYPAISVTVNDGFVESYLNCSSGYVCTNNYDQSSFLLIDHIRKSGVFEGVETNNSFVPYRVSIAFQRKSKEDNVAGFAKVLVSSASLFLIPMNYEVEYQAAFVVMYKDQKIANYEYTIDHESQAHLFNNPDAPINEATNILVERFLNDAIRDGIFEATPSS